MQKIMFNDLYGLTEAVLDGRKTMTRRIIKFGDEIENMPIYGAYDKEYQCAFFSENNKDISTCAKSAYKVGEVVAIAQNYKDVHSACNPNDVRYKPYCTAYSVGFLEATNGWHNKMFVRADIMPNHIKITDIKVERLQDIPEEECLREGIMEGEFLNTWDRYYFDTVGDVHNHHTFKTPRAAFAALIDKVGKKGTWASNPWVFAYSFELVD